MAGLDTERSIGAASRIFAVEFFRSDYMQGTRRGRELVTQTGGRCGRMYISGALTEVCQDREGLSARIADPTGSFEVRVGERQESLVSIVTSLEPPQWVALIGSGRIGRMQPGRIPFIRPDEFRVVDRTVRDSWVITTASMTIGRVRTMAEILESRSGDPFLLALAEQFRITRKDLREILGATRLALASARPVAGLFATSPGIRESVIALIRERSGPKGIAVKDLAILAGSAGIGEADVIRIVKQLILEDEIYQPSAGIVRLL